MAGVLAYKTIVNNLIGHKFARLAFCQEGLYGMPCSEFQPVQPVGWKLSGPGRWGRRVGVAPLSVWARRVGVAVRVLPPEMGVAPLSACLWHPALSGYCSQPSR